MTKDLTRTLIEFNEGRRNKLYQCTAGFWTVGVGRNLEANPLSDAAIDFLLDEDIAAVEAQLDKHLSWWREHDEVRRAVLIDLAFNMGINGLLGFKNTLAAFRAKNYEAAASGLEKSKWFSQVGNRGPRIVNMVRTGQWPKEIA
jgi:lysozyme